MANKTKQGVVLTEHPVSQVEWIHVNQLQANMYNPNVVLTAEMKLLKFSIIRQGWIQPILVCKGAEQDTYEIIDGYHRFTLAKTDSEVNALTSSLIPVVILDLTKPERMLLTIRINRAKGNHVAVKMHDIVAELINVHKYPIEKVAEGIGGTKEEVKLLLMDDIFQKKNVANTPYSKSWIPQRRKVVKESK